MGVSLLLCCTKAALIVEELGESKKPWPCLQYEELVEAGSVTTYDNTTINFSYNDYLEVLGGWQDPTHARAFIDYAVYPYGKVSRLARQAC